MIKLKSRDQNRNMVKIGTKMVYSPFLIVSPLFTIFLNLWEKEKEKKNVIIVNKHVVRPILIVPICDLDFITLPI